MNFTLSASGARSARSAALVFVIASVVAFPAYAPAREFRLITYDYKQRTEDTLTYGTYAANLELQLLAAQAHFSASVPTLAFLPENTGLMAWFVGPRGDTARTISDSASPDSSAAAIASLGTQYAPQVAYYQGKCPGIPAARALVLALTDTAWRALAEPIAALAAQHQVWIMTSLNVAELSVTRDPAVVAVLADPDHAAKGYAYEGGCEAWNYAYLFPPSAQLANDGAADPGAVTAGFQRKVYLVPVERDQGVGLTLSSESPAAARVIDTPFARLGVLTSKDAWMSDVTERLEIDGMEVFMQPEAGAWAGHDGGLPTWPPEAMQRAVYSMTQWLAETSIGTLSNLTGNLGDLYFDGTATVVRDAGFAETPFVFLLGKLPKVGLLARAPWVFADPPDGIALADVAARRASLDADGAKLVPASGDALENGQTTGFTVTDHTLPDLGAVAPRLPRNRRTVASVAVAPAGGAQWSPSLAFDQNETAHLVWTDLRDGHETPYVSRLAAAETAWTAAVKAGDASTREFDQQDNQYDARIAVHPDGGLQLVWADFRNQSWDIYGAASGDAGASWGTSQRVDDSPSSAEGYPNENIHQDPSVTATGQGTLIAAWSDLRSVRSDRGVSLSRSTDAGATWSPSINLDGTGSAEIDQWSPVVAAGGRNRKAVVVAAWQGFRDGINQIYYAVSTDDGAAFDEARPVSPSASDQWQPSVAVARNGQIAVAWSEGSGGGARTVRALRIKPNGKVRSFAADPDAPAGVRQARPALAALRSKFWIAWQDDRAGDWDVIATKLRGKRGRPERVDDGPEGSDARLPTLAGVRKKPTVAWEDDRSGTEQVRAVALR